MYDHDWKIKIIDPGYKGAHDVYIFRSVNGLTEVMGKNGTISKVLKGSAIPTEPFMEMDDAMMQEMSDALAKVGIKPQKGFVEGKLEATERHLEDMRSLLFMPKKRINQK